MDYIKIGNKEYPFVITAAVAMDFYAKGEGAEGVEASSMQMDLIYQGLIDGSYRLNWFQRNITNRIPSKKRFLRMLTMTELSNAVNLIFPTPKGQEVEEDSEKKQ
jgi:hypothetical protein